MNTKMLKIVVMALVPVVMLGLASCSKEHKKSSAKMNQPVEIGRLEAVVITTTATVTTESTIY
jgi:hypothetical protein